MVELFKPGIEACEFAGMALGFLGLRDDILGDLLDRDKIGGPSGTRDFEDLLFGFVDE